MVDADFELSKDNFVKTRLPDEANFIDDTRPDTRVIADGGEPCMTDCKPGEVKVTGRARVLDVTPEEQGDGAGSVD